MPQVNDFDMSKYAHDFSGYVRAAEMRAQSMADIGQQIGAGITAFDTKRKEKKKKSEFENLVMPDLIKKYDGDVETAKSAASSLYSNPEAYSMVQEMQQLEQAENKYQVDLGMLQQMENGNMTPNELLQSGVDLKMIKDYTSVMGATTKQPVTAGTLSGISSAMTDAGVKLDKETGGFYKEDTGVPFYPLDNKNVPVDFNVKGADDYSKIYSNPSALDEDQWKILN
tara:strand:+ start:685 stop:1362 length:678 start_codon:yes stop_codon:yes gene_type:complete